METAYPFVRPSELTTTAFLVIIVAVWSGLVGLTAWAAHREARSPVRWGLSMALGVGVWAAVTGLFQGSTLMWEGLPVTLVVFATSNLLLAVGLALSPVGSLWARGLPVFALIGFHAFRLPLEVVLHAWYESGTIPVQMTWSGLNFDVVSGVLALVCGLWCATGRAPRWLPWFFAVVGTTLLFVVATIALTSAPVPFRQFLNDPPVLLPLYFPYGWIVPFAVGAALFAHIVLLRRLARGP